MNTRILLNQCFSLPLAAAPLAPVAGQTAGDDIRGIRGPVEIPPVPDWQGWALAALAAVFAIALLAYLIRGARRGAALRVLGAREQALADLEKARELMVESASREFSYAVSDVLRGFLEVRFSLPSTRRTTDEFLQTIVKNGKALGPYRETLADFLKCCDLGKFGKWQLSENEMNALYHSAVSVINAELDDQPSSAGPGEDSSHHTKPSKQPPEPVAEPSPSALETKYANS